MVGREGGTETEDLGSGLRLSGGFCRRELAVSRDGVSVEFPVVQVTGGLLLSLGTEYIGKAGVQHHHFFVVSAFTSMGC